MTRPEGNGAGGAAGEHIVIPLDYGPDPCIANGCPCSGLRFIIPADSKMLIATTREES